jgi:hypothetical protein
LRRLVRISWALVISGAPRSKISLDGFGHRHKPLRARSFTMDGEAVNVD